MLETTISALPMKGLSDVFSHYVIVGFGFIDYGARMYDDFTGRWFVPDPLAEKYDPLSPLVFHFF